MDGAREDQEYDNERSPRRALGVIGVVSMAAGRAGEAPGQEWWLDRLVLFRNRIGKLHFRE